MKNILKNFVVVTVCGFLLPAAAMRSVAAQTAPGGSYQQSCQNAKMAFGHMLYASCRTKSGAFKSSQLRYIYLCGGDISNNDGNLTCSKTGASSPQFKAALNAFSSASEVFFGRPLNGSGIDENSELLKWTAVMHAFSMQERYRDGTRFTDALAVMKKEVANQPTLQMEIINRALKDVYGAAEQAKINYWMPLFKPQQAWYALIVGAEKQNLNKDKAARAAMLNRVYQTAFGRSADQTNLGYWLPRSEIYRDVIEANRNWLYSPNGKDDLRETIKRWDQYQKSKLGKPNAWVLTEEKINQAMAEFGKDRKIYAEMVGQK